MTGSDTASYETRTAVSKWFLVNGFVTASWVAHVPRQTIELRASHGELGLALLCMALGSILGMMAAPRMIACLGAGRSAWVTGIVFLCLVPLPILAGSVVSLGLSLLAFGAAHGLMDVTMNSAAATCEKALGRSVMSSFHGWFSMGMVTGVSGGVAVLKLSGSPAFHAALVMAIVAWLLGTSRPRQRSTTQVAKSDSGGPWGIDRSVAAIACLAFICLFLEGAMADWSGLLAVAYGAGPVTAPLAYVAFTATWAGGRFVGDRFTDSIGEVGVVRTGGLFAMIGTALAITVGTPIGVAIGCGIVGIGLANAVPVLFRRGARVDATGRGLAIVTGVGYTGFLVGPPLVGFTAEAVGLPRSMLLVVLGGLLLATGAFVLSPVPEVVKVEG